MRVYRICREKRAKSLKEAFDGKGAAKIGGRWNPKKLPAVYTSSTASLALLEVLVHADLEDLPDDLVCVSAHLPDKQPVFELTLSALPNDWRSLDPPLPSLAKIGRKWIEDGQFLLMSVPSVIIPDERNYIINPKHTALQELSDFELQPFGIDPRLGIGLT